MADTLSRLHVLGDVGLDELSRAHGGRAGHNGIHRTYEQVKLTNPESTIDMEDVPSVRSLDLIAV